MPCFYSRGINTPNISGITNGGLQQSSRSRHACSSGETCQSTFGPPEINAVHSLNSALHLLKYPMIETACNGIENTARSSNTRLSRIEVRKSDCTYHGCECGRDVCFLGNPTAFAASPAARAASNGASLALLQHSYHDAPDLRRSRHHKQVHPVCNRQS